METSLRLEKAEHFAEHITNYINDITDVFCHVKKDQKLI